MPRRAYISVLLALAACSLSTTVYRDTWQPVDIHDAARRRLLTAALLVRSEDLEALQHAGGELIGYHEASKGWALRAASTGGTHFVPAAAAMGSRTDCVSVQPTNLIGFSQCTSSITSRWTRVAVFRVEPKRWHELPVWLIPPAEDIEAGIEASAWRVGCDVARGRGGVRCGSDWTVETTHRPMRVAGTRQNPDSGTPSTASGQSSEATDVDASTITPLAPGLGRDYRERP